MHPYAELIELAERERRTLASGDYAALTAIVTQRESLMRQLPDEAPQEAREAIEKLLQLQRESDELLKRAASGITVELTRLRTGRAGVRRYAPVEPTRTRRLDYSA